MIIKIESGFVEQKQKMWFVLIQLLIIVLRAYVTPNFFSKDALMTAEEKNWMKAEW